MKKVAFYERIIWDRIFEKCATNKTKNTLMLGGISNIEKIDKKVNKENQPAYIVKMVSGKKRIGSASVCYNPESNRNFLYNVKIAKKYRGQGLSHNLIDYMIKQHNVSELYVGKDNATAIGLYNSHNFKVTDNFSDKYVMRRDK